jgi:hypothetical protein
VLAEARQNQLVSHTGMVTHFGGVDTQPIGNL